MEILYRIYEVADEDKEAENSMKDLDLYMYSSKSKAENIELVMDCMVVESRDKFKEAIRSYWGADIAFRYNKNLKPGQLYCIIIGECFNGEKYFLKSEYDCDMCGKHVVTYAGHSVNISDSEIKYRLYNIQEFKSKNFCCQRCKEQYVAMKQAEVHPDENNSFYVTRDMFTEKIAGYIYKITKKSTGEFYVGQTAYAPMFRWAEHMKTERFPISNIEDYMFEVLEIVPKTENLLDRETFYIQSLFKEQPDKSLNIMQTQILRKQYNISGGDTDVQ